MKNKDKLIKCCKSLVRAIIMNRGVFNGVVKLANGRLVLVTFTNIASINNPDLLEFYKISS